MQAPEKVVSPALARSPAQPLMRWTVEDYHRLVDSGVIANRRVELINGSLVEMAPEGAPHSHTIRAGSSYLQRCLQAKAVISAAHPITLAQSEPEPDIAIVKSPESRYITRHPCPDDIFWLIEVSKSTLTYDLTYKKQLYAEANIQEYWVADIVARQIYVFRQLKVGTYTEEVIYKTGAINPVAFPAIAINVDALLGEVG